MDAKFYQFWSDFIKQAAEGQGNFKDFTGWMRQGPHVNDMPGIPDEMMAMFKKYYGLDQMSADAPDYSTLFESSLKEFNDSLANLYSILEVVPKKDYLDLEKKYNALKKKAADLEEAVRQLKLLFKTSTPDVDEGIGSMNQMLKTQNENFLKMMDSLAGFYGISKDKEADKTDKDTGKT